MNHFSYPLTIVQISIFEEPQNIFPNQNPRPQAIEPAPPPVFLTTECPPGKDFRYDFRFEIKVSNFVCVLNFSPLS